MIRPCDPATWAMRWWLPLAALVTAAGLWMQPPDPGPSPFAPAAPAPPVAASGCGELDDALRRAACNSR